MRVTLTALILLGTVVVALLISSPFIWQHYRKRQRAIDRAEQQAQDERDRAEQAALDEEMRRLDEQLRRNREENP